MCYRAQLTSTSEIIVSIVARLIRAELEKSSMLSCVDGSTPRPQARGIWADPSNLSSHKFEIFSWTVLARKRSLRFLKSTCSSNIFWLKHENTKLYYTF